MTDKKIPILSCYAIGKQLHLHRLKGEAYEYNDLQRIYRFGSF